MSDDEPHNSRYDTNPLPRPGEAAPEVDTEAPTQPMPNAPPAPEPARVTAPHPYDTSPYATTPAAETRAAYMPPNPQTAFQQPPGPPAVVARPTTTSVTAQYGIQQNFAAMACYLPFIGLVASVALTVAEPPENRFVRFHAKQSMFAHVCFWAGVFAFSIARAASPTVMSLLLIIPQLAYFVATIAGFVYLMVKAYRWQTVKIPIIGEQVE
jgi:uncharacterized membrane protein